MLNNITYPNTCLIKAIIIPSFSSINLIYLKFNKFLILDSPFGFKKYFLIPNELKVKKLGLKVIFKLESKFLVGSNSKKVETLLFLKKFIRECFKLKKKSFKVIIIRGIALKISFLESNHLILQLKLGFSHLILLPIPVSLKVFIFKRKIIVEGFNYVEVSNFSSKLKKFKPVNIYTGKGLWIRSKQKIQLKEIKKI